MLQMLGNRTALVAVIAILAAALWWSIDNAASTRADLEQANKAITHLGNTIKQERDRYDRTDQMLAATTRDRDWLNQEASALAKQLADARSGSDCINRRIDDAAALRLFRFRDRNGGSPGTSPADLDATAPASRPRPTYGEYIAAAEQFVAQCNADRRSVEHWSREQVNQ